MPNADSIVLQKFEFNCNEDLPDSMFYKGSLTKEIGFVTIKEGCSVSFDTYFNMLSLKKYREYTTIKRVELESRFCGKARLLLWGIKKDKEVVLISDGEIESSTEDVFKLYNSYDMNNAYDYLFIRIISISTMIIKDIQWRAYSDNIREVLIACCFCTYKREMELKKSVNNVLRAASQNDTRNSIYIYISDNGNTINEGFWDDGGDIVYTVPNKNYGGSAGFTRCIIEALFNSPRHYSNIILMDDDALIEPYVIERTYALLSVLKPEWINTMIGGALFAKETPLLQIENGGFLGDYCEHTVCNVNKTMDSVERIIDNETSTSKNYCGFYYCCLPRNVINDTNLPLNLFIKCDDEEYCKRNFDQIITMNGIAVWHPNPYRDVRPHMSYYYQRNNLILASEFQPTLSRTRVSIQFAKSCMSKVLRYRYQDAWYLIRAVEDFYKGIGWFKEQNPERLNDELVTMNKNIEIDIAHIYKNFVVDPCPQKNKRGIKILLILNLIIPAIWKRKIYSIECQKEDSIYLFTKKIILVDEKKGIILEKKALEGMKIVFSMIKTICIIVRRHPIVFIEWNKGINIMKTLDYWINLLDIDIKNVYAK